MEQTPWKSEDLEGTSEEKKTKDEKAKKADTNILARVITKLALLSQKEKTSESDASNDDSFVSEFQHIQAKDKTKDTKDEDPLDVQLDQLDAQEITEIAWQYVDERLHGLEEKLDDIVAESPEEQVIVADIALLEEIKTRLDPESEEDLQQELISEHIDDDAVDMEEQHPQDTVALPLEHIHIIPPEILFKNEESRDQVRTQVTTTSTLPRISGAPPAVTGLKEMVPAAEAIIPVVAVAHRKAKPPETTPITHPHASQQEKKDAPIPPPSIETKVPPIYTNVERHNKDKPRRPTLDEPSGSIILPPPLPRHEQQVKQVEHSTVTAREVPVITETRTWHSEVPKEEVPEIEHIVTPSLNAEHLTHKQVMKIAEKVRIDGISLKKLFREKYVREDGLRRILTEHLRGHDVKKALVKELFKLGFSYETGHIRKLEKDIGVRQHNQTAAPINASLLSSMSHTPKSHIIAQQHTNKERGKHSPLNFYKLVANIMLAIGLTALFAIVLWWWVRK